MAGVHLPSEKHDCYLTIAPRGLESFIIKNIRSQLTSNGYRCWISEIGPSPLTQLHNTHKVRDTNNAGGSSSSGHMSDDPLDEIAARIEYNKHKKTMKKRKKENKDNSQDVDPSETIGLDYFMSQNYDNSRSTGSIDVPSIGSHVSIGYHTQRDDEGMNNVDGTLQRILSVPGTLEGVVLLTFQTDAPSIFVASMSGMGCGPLLALITSSCLNSDSNVPRVVDGRLFDYDQTLEQACSALQSFFDSKKDVYPQSFESAFDLWHRHTKKVWHVPNSIYGHYKDNVHAETNLLKPTALDADTEPEPEQQSRTKISYRLSCTRSHSKKYSHQREALIDHLGGWVIPWDSVHQLYSKTNFRHQLKSNDIIEKPTNLHLAKLNVPSEWTVNLKDYDIEIVSMVHYGCLTIAIPLRPYQLWGSRAYRSNSIPVDGSGCFGRLGPKRSLGRYIHLRPSTADILISIADLPPHSIILDPCAGIGTINIRASFQNHYGFGGEILPCLFEEHAPYFLDCNAKFQTSHRKGVVDMAGWDATMLPIRDSFVDAVISDIPFGQKCLTHNELHAFMSGFIYECARVLVKNTGKMVLLCGDCEIVLSKIKGLNERSHKASSTELCSGNASSAENAVFHLPCESLFPVSITGILAWVVVVNRGSDHPVPSTNYRVKPKPKNKLSYAR